MVKRRYKPVITRDSVAAALNKLLYGYGDESIIRPLYRLSLVEDILSDRDYPSVENSLAREYALNKSLTEFIFINYSKRRQHRGLVIPSLNASYSEICKTLEIDGQAGAGNWSYFYHRYVRADARIDQKQYAELLAVSSRGLRRYEENVFEQFIQILIDAEWESRRNHIKRYLHTRLPFYEKTIPVEHEVVFNQVMEQISIEQTATIHLTGAAGTGKSALCHRVANQLIEQEQLDHIIWLNHVDNPEVVYDSIWRLYQGRRNGEKHTLRMFLQQHRFLVVLDNVRCQPDDSLNALFADLSFSTLLMTACDYIHMSGHIHHYHLSNLDLDETTMLVEQIVPVGFMYSSADIYAVTQGNPSEIYKYVHQLISDETLTPTVSSVYENMSDEQKRLCLLLSLHFQGAVSKEQLLFFDNYTEQDLQFLMDTQVIRVIDSDRYMLSSEFYQYIHDNELFNHYLKEIIIGLLQVNLPALLPLVEHLLGTFKNY
ncbi:MAG: NB-ARC domain-containing protein, partial [Aggregatilineales bacterium]